MKEATRKELRQHAKELENIVRVAKFLVFSDCKSCPFNYYRLCRFYNLPVRAGNGNKPEFCGEEPALLTYPELRAIGGKGHTIGTRQ